MDLREFVVCEKSFELTFFIVRSSSEGFTWEEQLGTLILLGKGLYMQLNEDSSTKDIIGKFIRTHFDEIENLFENRLVFGQN